MKIIEDWKRATRGYSTIALSLLAAVTALWGQLPPEVVDVIPEAYRGYVLASVAVAGLVGRFIKQGDA